MKCSSDGYVVLVFYFYFIKKMMLIEWVVFENKLCIGWINIFVYVEVMFVIMNVFE